VQALDLAGHAPAVGGGVRRMHKREWAWRDGREAEEGGMSGKVTDVNEGAAGCC
jgi:nicotinic acid phosphoribosyltransferase